ncbi:type I polyketide synthase [Tautonia rosea]|uniref:type I polyketide synthase n=1 Tax=Tautonia rosea TaxID=2728037 RepID=UPI0014766402|nr:type I polyketide synthase [Tautonia rosea]
MRNIAPSHPGLPRILILIPSETGWEGSLVAAGRSGALGVLDLDRLDPLACRSALDRVQRWVDRPFAARIESHNLDPERWPDRLEVVICVGDRLTPWDDVFRTIHQTGRVAVAEVVDRDAARAAREAGADGLIVAGLEAGGRCGSESSFILLQGVLADGPTPCWVRGGIGKHSAAACLGAGASGVILEGAVLLARESPLQDSDRARIARLDGGETLALGPEDGLKIRVDAPPGSSAVARLKAAADEGGLRWLQATIDEVGWSDGQARPIGQDGAFASDLARRGVTIGGIVQIVSQSMGDALAAAATTQPLAPESPTARSLGTRFPIVQGPMTRVSDSARFADAVAEGGALPMLALAMLRGPASVELLNETAQRLAGKAWGVGLLGFVDPALRAEQIEAIRQVRPPFALIAGGRPDQAEELEQIGIQTFLHAPSPGLLGQYLRNGARRFVLEGRECGGHVGPRSSLVLWDQAVALLQEGIDQGWIKDPKEIHVLFAGGVHDARSAAGVATLAGQLSGRGVKVGLLVGTAYLFTKEAVETEAIAPRFQAEAVRCRSTVLLPTGPGHEVRAVPSPFTEQFATERKRLIEAGTAPEAIQDALEALNVGRLRVASKGLDRGPGAGASLQPLSESEQYARGLYMIGQVATLRDRVTTIAELHDQMCVQSTALLDRPTIEPVPKTSPASPSDVAIVGMAAIMPGAQNLHAFWNNTLKGVNAIVEVPSDHWDWRPYYDPDGKAPDKIISKWGGFLPDILFDPLRYGMPPTSLPSIEPAQLLVLEAVSAALDDAGYSDRPFPKDRTAVVLGMGGGAAQLAMGYAFRSYLPMLESIAPEAGRTVRAQAEQFLPEWTEDAFPGFLLNVTAGRVANRFDLGGANYTVDAACGSSLAAASLAVRELETHAADMVILGGADTVQNPFTYLAFSKTHAFSPRGRCRPFDASADGIVISEGVGVVVLKRLADAERDGDRIYAVIKGLGSSSDGRARGLTAPNGDGQTRALARAYAKAGVEPQSVGYVEAHGTGTAVGDVVEVNALAEFLRQDGAAPGSVAVGSVKSMIGHTKCAAGLAGLINASLSLYHKTLPPTIGVERLNPAADLRDGPLRVSSAVRPWLHSDRRHPRRAGVSAFGFGGTNFHAVLEAYEGDPAPRPDPIHEWPAELFVWKADDRDALRKTLDQLARSLDQGSPPILRDLAHTLLRGCPPADRPRPTLAITAGSIEQLRDFLDIARQAIDRGDTSFHDPRGIAFEERPPFLGAKVAFLFPGQGAQRLEMLLDLAIAFDEVRSGYESVDTALFEAGRSPVGPNVFPPPTLDDADRARARLALTATDVAQPAVGAASVGMLRCLDALGIRPDLVAGHSYGELVALHASGSLDVKALAVLSEARGRWMIEAAGTDPGVMTAFACDADQATALIDGLDDVVLANRNGPRQSVVAGGRDAVNRAIELARSCGVRTFDLPVGAAFHSPRVAGARKIMTESSGHMITSSPLIPVYSNLDAQPYPNDPASIAQRLGDHLASPVQFSSMIEAMSHAGAQVFIECGPGAILAPLVKSILGDRPHLAVSCDVPGSPAIPTLLKTLGRLLVAGVAMDGLERLTRRRNAQALDLSRGFDRDKAISASTWLVNGSRARPINGQEPKRLGMALDHLKQGNSSGPILNPSHRPESNGGRTMPQDPIPTHPGNSARNGHPIGNGSGANQVQLQSYEEPIVNDQETSSLGTGSEGVMSRGPFPNTASAIPDARVPSPISVTPSGSERVMESFQETMRLFLQVQRETMRTYLTGRSADTIRTALPEDFGTSEIDQNIQTSGTGHRNRIRHDSGVNRSRSRKAAEQEPTRPNRLAETEFRSATHRSAEEVPIRSDLVPASPSHSSAIPETEIETKDSKDTLPDLAVAQRLVAIVQERTGYPVEMLGMDLDLEADLGIDSIKRVEILGTLRDSIEGLQSLTASRLMDGLTRSKTLGEIVDRVESALAESEGRDQAPNGSQESLDQFKHSANGQLDRGPVGFEAYHSDALSICDAEQPSVSPENPSGGVRLQRMVLESVEAPVENGRSSLTPGGTLLVTEDRGGVARLLADQFGTLGFNVERVGSEWADLTSPTAVTERYNEVRTQGPLTGILHVQPLGNSVSGSCDPIAWFDQLGPQLRGLFLLARAAAEDLERSARLGGSCLIAATAMGGAFGSLGALPDRFFPGQGGISGLVKTLSREWPAVRSRVVDLDPSEDPAILADHLMFEAMHDDGWPEVGYRKRRRIRLRAVERELEEREPVIQIHSGEPILITGGARGITSAVAVELARCWHPTLLLLGTSPRPEGQESAETLGLDGASALKAAILDRARREGRSISPSDLERSYRSLLRAREIRTTIDRLQAEGTTVDYAQVDVRDHESLGRVLNRWKRQYGEPVGLIHGAGVIHDKLLRDKTPESFDHVLGTKIDGALNLARLLRGDSLRFSALFSSVAGRFGNQGQSDYAAANEVLNKFALWLDRQWPGRVVSVNWGPWAGVGMVSELQEHLGRRGLGMIDPGLGCKALVDELRFGRKGDVEVILASDLGGLDAPLERLELVRQGVAR